MNLGYRALPPARPSRSHQTITERAARSRSGDGPAGARRLLLAIACLCPSLAATAAEEGLSPQVLERVKEATVYLRVGAATGSGFVVADGLVATNAHVLGLEPDRPYREPAKIEVVLHSGTPERERVLTGTCVGADTGADLAFVKVAGEGLPKPLALAPTSAVRETIAVFSLGFPLGAMLAVAGNPTVAVGSGSVSSLRQGADGALQRIQLDIDLNPGNSGGPIVLASGEVIGVAVSGRLGTDISFAVPAEAVQRDLDGQVLSLAATAAVCKGKIYEVDLSARMVDPLARLQTITVNYWINLSGLTRVPGQPARMAGDGPAKHLAMARSPTGAWTARITGLTLADGANLVAQCSWRSGGTSRQTEPVDLAIRRLADTTQKEAARPPTSQPESTFPFKKLPAAVALPAPVINPAPPLPGREERDAQGRTYVAVAVNPETIPLDAPLIQVVAAPSGRELYAIYDGLAKVRVLDPASLAETAAIPVPRLPASLWCDEDRLLVACTESQVVSLIDTRARKPLKSFRTAGMPAPFPRLVFGRSVDDGSLVACTAKASAAPEANDALYHLGSDGAVRPIVPSSATHAVWLEGGALLTGSGENHGLRLSLHFLDDPRRSGGNPCPWMSDNEAQSSQAGTKRFNCRLGWTV